METLLTVFMLLDVIHPPASQYHRHTHAHSTCTGRPQVANMGPLASAWWSIVSHCGVLYVPLQSASVIYFIAQNMGLVEAPFKLNFALFEGIQIMCHLDPYYCLFISCFLFIL